MRKYSWIAVLLAVLCLLGGCTKTKTVHCDRCGKEATISEKSNMEEDWIIYCKDCEEELFGDNPIVEEGDLPPTFADQE